MYMQIDYIRKRRKPVINGDFVKATAESHYHGIERLLERIDNSENEQKRSEIVKKANDALADIAGEEKEKYYAANVKKALKSKTEEEIRSMKEHVLNNILAVTTAYNPDSIENAINKVLHATKEDLDERTITQKAFERLQNSHTDRRPPAKKIDSEDKHRQVVNYLNKESDEEDLI